MVSFDNNLILLVNYILVSEGTILKVVSATADGTILKVVSAAVLFMLEI
jgi:hypothetical protein